MTEGEKTMRRIIAATSDPRTDPKWWLDRLLILQLCSLAYVMKTVYVPIIKIWLS